MSNFTNKDKIERTTVQKLQHLQGFQHGRRRLHRQS